MNNNQPQEPTPVQYVGRGKEVPGKGLIGFSICLEDTLGAVQLSEDGVKLLDLFTPAHTNGKHYVNFTMGSLKQTDQYGNSHSVWRNNWKPDPAKKQEQQKPVANHVSDDLAPEDIPF